MMNHGAELPANLVKCLFCPFDGNPLRDENDAEGVRRSTCAVCGFIDYANPRPCVAILAECKGEVLLVRRRTPPRKGTWDIPGGFIHSGETAEEAAARELQEETGLRAASDEMIYRMSIADVYGLPVKGSRKVRRIATLNLCYSVIPKDWKTLRSGSDAGKPELFSPKKLFSRKGVRVDLAFGHQKQLLEAWRKRWPK